MSMENPLWGAPRIHGELLKLGFQVAQSSLAESAICVQQRPPSGLGGRNLTGERGSVLKAPRVTPKVSQLDGASRGG